MRSSVVALAVVLAATEAEAEGFAVRDLSQVVTQAKSALGGAFAHRAEPQRVSLICPSCDGQPMIDLLLGRQTDGTEARVRSGETPISRMEDLCRARNDTCRLSALSVAPAVAWITSYSLGTTAGSTAVVLRDGDLLTIRSIASDPAVARRNTETLVRAVVPTIVGR
jgi:hypothetical protein